MAASLWTRVRGWATPPRFDDEDQNRIAELLHYFSLAVIVGASFSMIATVTGGVNPRRAVFPATIILIGLLSYVLIRLSRVWFAGLLTIGGLWVITTLSAGTGGGLSQPSIIFYVMTIILAAVLLDDRAAVVFTGLSVLSCLAMADLASQGKHSPVIVSSRDTAVGYLTLYITLFLAAGIVLYLTGRNIRSSIERLRRSEQEYRGLYATARRQAQELTLLDQVRTTLAREISLPALFRTVTKSVTEAFGYTQVSLYLLEGDALILQDQAGYEHCLERIPLTTGVTGRVARTGKPASVEDVKSDPDFVAAMPGIVSEVCVPLMQNDHVVGVLNVESIQGVSLTRADLSLMVTLSKDIEIAIGRAQLYQDIQRQLAERKKAERELQEATSFLHQVVDTFPGMIFVTDGQGGLEFVNRYAAQYYASSPEELITKSAEDIHPSGVEAREFVSDDQEVIHTRRKIVKEEMNTTPNGEKHWFHTIKVPLLSPGGAVKVLGISTDITDRIRATEELERHRDQLEKLVEQRTAQLQQTSDRIGAILDSVGEAIMVVKPDGRIEQVNRAFEEQTGYLAAEIELRNHQDVLFDDAMPREVYEASAHAMRTGTGWRGEMPVRRKDGSHYDASVTITTMFNPTKQRIAFVGILRDISALKEVERLKDQFVANVSHELRTPITNIRLYLDLLDMKPEKYATYLATLKRENTRLERLIEGLLTLSRLDQNRMTVNLAPLDLNGLIDEYVADRALLAKNKGLKLICKPALKLPTCDGDRNLLGQVLSILLTNALNYTPPGGAVHVCSQGRQIDGQEWVGFSVIDTGPGIEPGETGKLFTRFFRGKAGVRSGVAGTGLGLAIAREIVMLHHGQIEAFNNGPRAKRGATFQLWLPIGVFQGIDS